jgi:hypothetical protein
LQIDLMFTFACGTTLTAPANGWQAGNFIAGPGQFNLLGTVNNQAQIWDVGLYADPNRTGLPPAFQVPDYALDLMECQRYFETASGASIYGYQLAGAAIQSNYPFKVKKRVVPSMGTLSWGSTNNGGSQVPNLMTVDGFVFQANAVASGTMFFQGLSCNANARM